MKASELLRRAATKAAEITSGSNLASAGKLNATQLQQFLNWTIDQSKFLQKIDRIIMPAETYDLDSIAVSTRILRAGTEATAGTNVGVTHAKRTLTVTEVIIPWECSYSYVEDNIEGDGVMNTIMRIMAKQFANDLADLGLNGDGATGNFLSINKGIFQLIKDDIGNSHLYDTNSSTDYIDTVFPAIKKALPIKYRELPGYELWCNWDNYEDIAKLYAARATSIGDDILLRGNPPQFGGIPIIPIPYVPSGTFLLINPKDNIVMGLHRDIRLETDKDIQKRTYQFVMTARIDFELRNLDGLVIAYDA